MNIQPFGLQQVQQQTIQFAKELVQVKKSPHYKKLESVNDEKGALKKIFRYHYAEDDRWHLGSGSYGEVYECFFEQIVTGAVHKFALKIIHVPSSIEEVKKIEDTVATTRQQIKSLVKLKKNPNIIKIEDVIGDKVHNCKYLILEYCNNKDLESYFEKQHQKGLINTQEQVLFYFKQLLHGFQDLYKYNIIHRDIKPANIFVHNNILKIGDFGLSRQLFEKKENLHDHRTIGTFLTSAPQLIFKQEYTNKCDIYSLGLTLYWMLFQKFPFEDINDIFDKQQLLKQSINFDNDNGIRPSAQLVHLLKSMLAFQEVDRIDWNDLFNHPLLARIKIPEPMQIRESIGRNLQGQNLQLMLEEVVPEQFYRYLGEESQLQATMLLGATDKGTAQCYFKILMEGKNFRYKVHFMKLLLREVYQVSHSQKIKNKIEFAIVKDLLRLGIDKYIILLNRSFLDQLNGFNTLHILDIGLLNELSCSKYFKDFVQRFSLQVQTYQNSFKKPKLSKQENENLVRNCQKYDITDKFHLVLGHQLLVKDYEQFLQEVKRGIVEMIYFVKQQIQYYGHQEHNLPQSQFNRYRQLVLLVHHLFMFIFQDKIFPYSYDPDIALDTEVFDRHELYLNKHKFLRLAREVNQIVTRFEN